MMAISLSSARVSQITQVLTKFTIDFSKPISPTNTAENILSVFDKDIHWYDHGFFVCRIGHEAVLGLNKAFLHCNQPFEPEINVNSPSLLLPHSFQSLTRTGHLSDTRRRRD